MTANRWLWLAALSVLGAAGVVAFLATRGGPERTFPMEVDVELSVDGERHAFKRIVQCELYVGRVEDRRVATWRHARNVVGTKRRGGGGVGLVVPAACGMLAAPESSPLPPIPLLPDYRPYVVESVDATNLTSLTIHVNVGPTATHRRVGVDRLEVRKASGQGERDDDDPFRQIRRNPSDGVRWNTVLPNYIFAGWRAVMTRDLSPHIEDENVKTLLARHPETGFLRFPEDYLLLGKAPGKPYQIPPSSGAVLGLQHPPCSRNLSSRGFCRGEQLSFKGVISVDRLSDQTYAIRLDRTESMTLYRWEKIEKLRPGRLFAWRDELSEGVRFRFNEQEYESTGMSRLLLLDRDSLKVYEISLEAIVSYH